MSRISVQMEESWKKLLHEEFDKPYFLELTQNIKKEKKIGKTIYPPGPLIFNAFNTTPVDKVKVVILGQDPYHNPGEAMGLSFSVPKGVRIPPSLKNIYKELAEDVGIQTPHHGDLTKWAQQGVFLLNAMLTVEHKKPGSHRKIGWQKFTNAVVLKLSEAREHLVFMLWGNFAKSKKDLIHPYKNHLILEAPHPSPLARGGFFKSKHFSQANDFFKENNLPEIDWSVD